MRTRRLYSVLGSGATDSFVLGKCSGTPPHFASPSSLITIVLFLERAQARGVLHEASLPQHRWWSWESDTTGELPGSSCGDFFAPIRCLRGISPSALRWRARASGVYASRWDGCSLCSSLLRCASHTKCSRLGNGASGSRRPGKKGGMVVLSAPADITKGCVED
ncbi:hypothetical protein B0H14DRAFT_3045970 [Mycena olivaceomarginata]|nr:hypothetical protein B0H14DRAFT_3045970 [Mycena olivaceomarginata]